MAVQSARQGWGLLLHKHMFIAKLITMVPLPSPIQSNVMISCLVLAVYKNLIWFDYLITCHRYVHKLWCSMVPDVGNLTMHYCHGVLGLLW